MAEDVKYYTDTTRADIKQTKKNLLKQLALAGNAGMVSSLNQDKRGRADRWQRYDVGVEHPGTPGGVQEALDAERQRMLGGLEMARGKQGLQHSKAMDRMAARNINYADAMKHASDLSEDALRERIAAMRLAAAGGGGGGGRGGGGGGGGGGGSAPLIGELGTENGSQKLDQLSRLFSDAASTMVEEGYSENALVFTGAAMDRYSDQTLAANTVLRDGLRSGLTPQEAGTQAYQALRDSGVDAAPALAITNALNKRHGGSLPAGRIATDLMPKFRLPLISPTQRGRASRRRTPPPPTGRTGPR